ncbi:MAG: UDP-N-acetylmuramoyl-tripeptide--D-alanyl-D-alanine ligase [Croceitalea sp.]|nr:UDP-N-acetylmuramoyl-tripeptide--D-alanyl-D-alanine ligase [Croceitalea sp.]
MNIDELHRIFLRYPLACTDTRKIEANSIYFALKGPNFNGNTFAAEALEKGAAYVVIDEEAYYIDDRTILVDDVLTTLQQLGTHHKNQCKAKVISLTGSNGKTTTKELINSVLSKKYKTIATKGNLNNHIGVPLTLLTIKEDTEIAIIEMGANHQGEIAFLSGLAQPDFGYITNFGKAHLEGFGGVEGVLKGKSELYVHLMEHGKYIFLNADDPIQKKKLSTYVKKYGFSQTDHGYFVIKFLEANPFVTLSFENITINSKLIGNYNFTNCCAAVLMGKYFNVKKEDIKAAIETYEPQNNRSQLINQNGFHIVLDAYNANPTSMVAALHSFKAMQSQNQTIVLGDMFELGVDADKEHQNIASLVDDLGFEDAYLVGEHFVRTTSKAKKFNDFDALATHLASNKLEQGTLLVKGSRGMAMERILKLI